MKRVNAAARPNTERVTRDGAARSTRPRAVAGEPALPLDAPRRERSTFEVAGAVGGPAAPSTSAAAPPRVSLVDVVSPQVLRELATSSTTDYPRELLTEAGIRVDDAYQGIERVSTLWLSDAAKTRIAELVDARGPDAALGAKFRDVLLADPRYLFRMLAAAVAGLNASGASAARLELPAVAAQNLDYARFALTALNRQHGSSVTVTAPGAAHAAAVATDTEALRTLGYVARLKPAEIEERVTQAVSKVTELSFLRGLAEKAGVKVWATGPTAAKLVAYSAWSLETEKGIKPYQAERFDFQFSNVFLPDDALQLSVDGPAAAVEAFEREARRTLSFASVRVEARAKTPARQPGVDDVDTLGVELSEPAAGEPRLVQLTGPAAAAPSTFAQQLSDGALQFRPPKPMTADAIYRHLYSLGILGLTPGPADREALKQAVAGLTDVSVSKSARVYALELLSDAVDLEQMNALVEELGLKAKILARGQGDPLAEAFDKQPLTSVALDGVPFERWGAGPQGAGVVAHRTRSLALAAHMTQNPSGKPNLLVSRARDGFGRVYGFGESAAYLPRNRSFAFYALQGGEGINGEDASFDVKMMVDPRLQASDFDWMSQYDGGLRFYAGALTVRPTNPPAIDFATFLDAFKQPSPRVALRLNDTELGVVRRRLMSQSLTLEGPARRALVEKVEAEARAQQHTGLPCPMLNEAIAINLVTDEATLKRWNRLGLLTRPAKDILSERRLGELWPWLNRALWER